MFADKRPVADADAPISPARRSHLRSLAFLSSAAVSPLAWAATQGEAGPGGAAARQATGMRPVDMDYAGYLVSSVGATPLASARLRAFEKQGQYEIELSVESFLADLTYRSTGTVGVNGLVPLQYREERKVAFRSPRQKSVNYVHTEDESLQNTRSGDQLYVPHGAQDRLSLILQIIWMSRRDPRVLSDKAEHELPFARVNRVTASRWRVQGPERLSRQDEDGGIGRSSQLGYRISRVANSRETVDVSMWLSQTAGHRPLVLQFAEKGRSLRFVHDSV